MKYTSLLILLIFIVFNSCEKQNNISIEDSTKANFVEFESDLAGHLLFQSYKPVVSLSEFELTNTFYSDDLDTLLWIKIRENTTITENILLSWINRTFEVSPLGNCSSDPPGSFLGIQCGLEILTTVPGGQNLSNFKITNVYYKETNNLGEKVYNIEGSFNIVVKNLSLGEVWNITNGRFCIQVLI